MAKKVKELDRVIIRHLEDYLTEPSEDVNENISLIKEALKRQELLTNELKDER